MAEHLVTGQKGEKDTLNYLLKQGYIILTTNWRFLHHEIDIVAKENDVLVFVEVKTRTSIEFGDPEVFVDLKKQKKLIKAANYYIEQYNLNCESRFDVVGVYQHNGKTEIKLIRDAFYPTMS